MEKASAVIQQFKELFQPSFEITTEIQKFMELVANEHARNACTEQLKYACNDILEMYDEDDIENVSVISDMVDNTSWPEEISDDIIFLKEDYEQFRNKA